MKGRKCSLIFMRKVANRLAVLEERYKDLSPKERARKINDEMLKIFCVGEREIRRWKDIVHLTTSHADINVREKATEVQPTQLMEIVKLPEEKQKEVLEQVIKKNMTVKETKKLVEEKLQKKVSIPEEPFNVIYADPPWQYEVNFLSASPEAHYPTMNVEQICSLVIPSSENAILFLWATNPLLKEALQVMKAWGFQYKTNLVWVKNKIGLGFYVRGQHELLLIGTKGKASPPEESKRVSSVLIAPSNGHSVKPEEVYLLIEKMYPNSKYLELFARKKRVNWVSWGNEIES